jgi:hypothetical protein
MVNSALASQVKRAGGDAAILMGTDRNLSGAVLAGAMLVAMRQRASRFQVIRYLY